jgi:hypothetical protein
LKSAAGALIVVSGLTGIPAEASSHSSLVPTKKVPLLVGVKVEGCRSFRQTIADTNTSAFAFTLKADCFHGKRLALTYRQVGWAGGKIRFRARGTAFGHRIRLSERVAGDRIRVTVNHSSISSAGEGTVVDHSNPYRSYAYYTLGRVSFQCTRWGGNWQDWSLQLYTKGLHESHYHGTPTRAQRQGLPWAVCAAMLTASDNKLPTNW